MPLPLTQQSAPPLQVAPLHSHTLLTHANPGSVQVPQFVVWPVPGFVSVLQLPPGAPASTHTGGPLQKNAAASGPASPMQAWPPGHAPEQSIVLPHPSLSDGWHSLG